MRLGIIGGTAMMVLAGEEFDADHVDEVVADTIHGPVPMTCMTLPDGHELIFVSRHHGEDGIVTPPHCIEHRANMKALACADVQAILAICSVGTIPVDFPPGSVGYATQFIDFSSKPYSYHNKIAEFTSMTAPFDPEINAQLAEILGKLQPDLKLDRTYWLTHGPHFESTAEINAIEKLGGEVVGMTMPRECKLAAELKIPYAAILIASNWAAGREPGDHTKDLNHNEVSATAEYYLGPVLQCIKTLAMTNISPYPEPDYGEEC
jgi:purine nucleoside phosphorylase